MFLWRISIFNSLSGDGGLVVDGRWHEVGRRIVYASEHPAVALLEMIVHADRRYLPVNYQLLKIRTPDITTVEQCKPLENDWQTNAAITQSIGNRWLADGSSAVLKVPCAILPESWNYLINPLHPDSKQFDIMSAQSVPLDARLK
jgi:RES domain-containing protein